MDPSWENFGKKGFISLSNEEFSHFGTFPAVFRDPGIPAVNGILIPALGMGKSHGIWPDTWHVPSTWKTINGNIPGSIPPPPPFFFPWLNPSEGLFPEFPVLGIRMCWEMKEVWSFHSELIPSSFFFPPNPGESLGFQVIPWGKRRGLGGSSCSFPVLFLTFPTLFLLFFPSGFRQEWVVSMVSHHFLGKLLRNRSWGRENKRDTLELKASGAHLGSSHSESLDTGEEEK